MNLLVSIFIVRQGTSAIIRSLVGPEDGEDEDEEEVSLASEEESGEIDQPDDLSSSTDATVKVGFYTIECIVLVHLVYCKLAIIF